MRRTSGPPQADPGRHRTGGTTGTSSAEFNPEATGAHPFVRRTRTNAGLSCHLRRSVAMKKFVSSVLEFAGVVALAVLGVYLFSQKSSEREYAEQQQKVVAYYNLAVDLSKQRKPAEAAAAYRKAIELKP